MGVVWGSWAGLGPELTHLRRIEAPQSGQVQLHERPEGPADALQPEQLAQRDETQDVGEQDVFPGQVQEPAGTGGIGPLLPELPPCCSPSPGGSRATPSTRPTPLPRPLRRWVPHGSGLLLPSGRLH